MKIIVFGASGGVGQKLVEQAIGRGHQVTAVTREGSKVAAHPKVTHVVANVLEPAAFEHVHGHDMVLSSLGLKRKSAANPWSALVSPADFCSRTALMMVDAMKRHGVRRVLAVSAAGVGDSAAALNLLMRFLLATSKVGVAYRDLDAMERVFAASGLDWCCPRPTRLTDGPLTGKGHIVDSFGMNAAISRADVAAWMLARVEDGRLEPRAPQISASA